MPLVVTGTSRAAPPIRYVKLLLLATIAGVLFLTAVYYGQRHLIYFPTRDVPDPSALGLVGVEQARFTAEDGVPLHGWFRAATGASRDLALLVCHGNGGDVAHRTHLLRALSPAGIDVLVFDYRGYGLSGDAAPSEEGLYRDGRAALSWLLQRTQRPVGRVLLYGESLGCGVAIELARGLSPQAPRALVLESPFTSLADAAAANYPWLPVRLLLRERYDNLAKIRDLHVPLLVMHGTRDSIVPIEQGRKIAAAAAEPVRFVAVEGEGHNDVWDDPASRLRDVLTFLDALPAAATTR